MKLQTKKLLGAALLSAFVLTACSSDDDNGDGNDSEGNGIGIGADANADIDTGMNLDIETEMNIELETSAFVFNTDSIDEYTRVDRMGMPAIATALIASKDAYNNADPVDDIAMEFVPEIIASLTFLHGALDAQLTGLGLTPCTVVGDGTGTCVAAAGPLILPDTLSIDTQAASGFPNGRMLTDPVIDITLAVALLELTGDPAPHTASDLVGVLNPTENDLEFQADFPFLAEPHE